MAAYATSADIAARYDVRTIGDLLADDGTRIAEAAFSANANLTAALLDASGEVEAALQQLRRYTPAELEALAGNSSGLLKRIVCKVAMGLLWERRQYIDLDKAEEGMDAARKVLEKLRKGEYIFDVTANVEAGTPEAITPTAQSISLLNLTVDRARGRNGYYPSRVLPGQASG